MNSGFETSCTIQAYHRNAALRGALTPLKKLAECLGAAVVLVSHLTKEGSANGKHRVLGSLAYVGACRANNQGELAPLALGLDRR
jgi:hypothetical protein